MVLWDMEVLTEDHMDAKNYPTTPYSRCFANPRDITTGGIVDSPVIFYSDLPGKTSGRISHDPMNLPSDYLGNTTGGIGDQ